MKNNKEKQTITIDFDVNLSLWNAIKLRIAGIEKVIKADDKVKEPKITYEED